jgi:hypothetical protein
VPGCREMCGVTQEFQALRPNGARVSERATPLASFNEFVRQVLLHRAGEADEEDVRAALLALETELDDMSITFHSQTLFREDDEAISEPIAQTYAHYHSLFAAVNAFREAFLAEASTDPSLDEAARHLNEIFRLYAVLREHAEKQPAESESVHLAELLRVARAVQAEKLPWDAFAARLDAYYASYFAFVDAFELQDEEGGTWGLTPEQREVTIACLQRIHAALAELAEELAEEPLESLKLATAELLALHGQVRAELEKPVQPFCCPRCGAENSRRDKICTACGAKLPRSVEDHSGSLDLHSEQPARTVPVHLQQLQEELSEFLAGSRTQADFESTLVSLLDAAERVEARLQSLPPVPDGAPQDMAQDLQQARKLLQQGQNAFVQRLDAMLEHCREGRFDLLRPEYEALLAAAESLMQLQEVAARLQARATSTS